MSLGRGLLRSVALHAALVGGVGAWLAAEGPLSRGGAGLAGAPRARVAMVGTIEAIPLPKERPAPAAREGVEIPQERRELPAEAKNPNPRVDEANAARTEESEGSSQEGPAAAEGQGGSGDTRSETIGSSDRSNAYGRYLAEVHRRIQSRMENPGFLARDHVTVLVLDVERSGAVSKIAIETSSGDPALDRRAVAAVQRAQPFPPWENDQRIKVPVQFRAN